MDSTGEKRKYLNVGCGRKYDPSWVNIDMNPSSPDVINCNLLKGIPFPDNSFDVIYHSQVLEHFGKDTASAFLAECYRVLRPGGILRVVVPDLENIAEQYLANLKQASENDTAVNALNYEWILLEMYDQCVRDKPGGNMKLYLQQAGLPNTEYLAQRIGHIGLEIIQGTRTEQAVPERPSVIRRIQNRLIALADKVRLKLFLSREEQQQLALGRFRLGGEIHYWMYDRYSLKKLLLQCGFKDAAQLHARQSQIPGWDTFCLDISPDGEVYDPTSLFMEARK